MYGTRDSTALMVSNWESNADHYTTQVSINDFTILRVIGRGSFGKVYLVQKNSDG